MTVGTDTAPAADEAGFITLDVAAVEPDTVVNGVVDSVRVTFDTGGHSIPFEHGQHLTLRHEFGGVEVRRSYSICSPAPPANRKRSVSVLTGCSSTDGGTCWMSASIGTSYKRPARYGPLEASWCRSGRRSFSTARARRSVPRS